MDLAYQVSPLLAVGFLGAGFCVLFPNHLKLLIWFLAGSKNAVKNFLFIHWVKNYWEFPDGLVVKDLELSLLWLGSLLWHGFNPWPRNFYMLWVWPKKVFNEKVTNREFPLWLSRLQNQLVSLKMQI